MNRRSLFLSAVFMIFVLPTKSYPSTPKCIEVLVGNLEERLLSTSEEIDKQDIVVALKNDFRKMEDIDQSYKEQYTKWLDNGSPSSEYPMIDKHFAKVKEARRKVIEPLRLLGSIVFSANREKMVAVKDRGGGRIEAILVSFDPAPKKPDDIGNNVDWEVSFRGAPHFKFLRNGMQITKSLFDINWDSLESLLLTSP